MLVVDLSAEQLGRAQRAGDERHRRALRRRLGDAHGLRGRYGAEIHRLGAIGELAVALWLGVSWVAVVDDFRRLDGDVGSVQVRSTLHPGGQLLVHPRDPSDARFVLVRLHRLPRAEIVGWIEGTAAKQARFWRELTRGRPCYAIPGSMLHDCASWNEVSAPVA